MGSILLCGARWLLGLGPKVCCTKSVSGENKIVTHPPRCPANPPKKLSAKGARHGPTRAFWPKSTKVDNWHSPEHLAPRLPEPQTRLSFAKLHSPLGPACGGFCVLFLAFFLFFGERKAVQSKAGKGKFLSKTFTRYFALSRLRPRLLFVAFSSAPVPLLLATCGKLTRAHRQPKPPPEPRVFPQ